MTRPGYVLHFGDVGLARSTRRCTLLAAISKGGVLRTSPSASHLRPDGTLGVTSEDAARVVLHVTCSTALTLAPGGA